MSVCNIDNTLYGFVLGNKTLFASK